MTRVLSLSLTKAFVFGIMLTSNATAFTLSMQTNHNTINNNKNTVLPTTSKLSASTATRRDVLVKSLATTGGVVVSTVAATTIGLPQPASAAPIILSTNNGIKYAVLKPAQEKRTPFDKDIVAIEYTGYLTDGTIFDSTHAEGKKNALMFQVGGSAVIEGLNEMVKYMGVGEKVQAIIPPNLAFGDKGICIETTGECLVKPKATLVYDIYLKRSAIPPP